ncbi:MAG: hypothetical protein ACI8T1_003868, partial [Verrucomicrobiales bacterium]
SRCFPPRLLATQLRLSYQLSSWFVLCWVSHPAGLCCLTAHERRKPSRIVVASKSHWRYAVPRSIDNFPSWHSPNFDDHSWMEGQAELGFGDGDETTTISSNDPDDPPITFYFRQRFHMNPEHAAQQIQLSLRRDNGAVIYIDGQEIARLGMAPGEVTATTLATEAQGGTKECVYEAITLPKDLRLSEGEHLLAVEIHQISHQSSDVSFDLELRTSDWSFDRYFGSASPEVMDRAEATYLSLLPSDSSAWAPHHALLSRDAWTLGSIDNLTLWLARARLLDAFDKSPDPAFKVVLNQPPTLTLAKGDERTKLRTLEESYQLVGLTDLAD